MKRAKITIIAVALTLLLLALTSCMTPSITISFETNGGKPVRSITITSEMTSVTLPSAVKSGYSFAGWYTDEGLTQSFDPSIIPTESITLYAAWDAQTVTVTFRARVPDTDTYNDTTVSVETGSSLSAVIPPVPEVTGYEGTWDLEGVNDTVSASITINAVYAKAKHGMTFEKNNAEEPYVINGYMGNPYELPEDPVRTGYTFAGWCTDVYCTQLYDFPTKFPGQDVTLYAWWINSSELFAYYRYEYADFDGGTQNCLRITGLNRSALFKSELYIPPEINGLPVKYIGWEDDASTPTASVGKSVLGSDRLQTIVLPLSIEYIGQNAFKNASALSSVIFAKNQGTMARWESVSMKAPITKICDSAFLNCTSLITFNLPASVQSLGANAFSADTEATGELHLVNFVIPTDSTLVSMGPGLFSHSLHLESIVLPASLTVISYDSFTQCGLRTISVSSGSSTFSTYGNSLYSKDFTRLIYVPNKAGSIAFHEKTEAIADNAFRNNDVITSVVLPKAIKTIGKYAFFGCKNMESVAFHSGAMDKTAKLTMIDEYAFSGMEKLTSIAIPTTCRWIEANAFSNDVALRTVTFDYNGISSSITTIGNSAFRNCGELRAVTFPAALHSIGDYCFYGCRNLTASFAPNAVSFTSVGSYAFYNCFALNNSLIVNQKELSLPSSATYIGDYAFSCDDGNTMQLCRLTFNGSLMKTIGDGAFKNCVKLETISPGSSLEDIGEKTFYNCSLLSSVSIVGSISLTMIRADTFYGCTQLREISLPKNVTSIEDRAFFNCRLLARVTAGSTTEEAPVTSVGESAFENCINLTVNDDSITQRLIFPKVKRVGKRAFFNCVALTKIYLPDTLESLGDRAFGNCTGIGSILFANPKLTSLGNETFYGCTSLSSVTIPNKVETIDGNPFTGCTELTSISVQDSAEEDPKFFVRRDIENSQTTSKSTFGVLYTYDKKSLALFPSGVSGSYAVPVDYDGVRLEKIGDYAFYSTSLSSVSLPITAQTGAGSTNLIIGAYSFAESLILSSVTFASGVTEVGDHAFEGCSNLSTLNMCNDSPLELAIGNYAFADTSLTQVVIPARTSVLGERAFYGSFNISAVHFLEADGGLTASAITIGAYCFAEASDLSRLDFPERLSSTVGASIGDHAFSWCVSVAEITWGGGDKPMRIGDYAFENCFYLQQIELPDRVKYVGSYAFKNTSGVLSVTLNGVTEMGTHAFYGNSKLESVVFGTNSMLVGEYAFYNDRKLNSIVINSADSTFAIGNYAFYGTSALSSFSLPSCVQRVGEYAFSHSGLTELELGSVAGITLGKYAFSDTKLTSVYLGSNIGNIDEGCFANNEFLSSVTFEPSFGLPLPKDLFAGVASRSSIDEIVIPDGVETIGESAFADITTLNTVTFGASLKSIGDSAFRGCESLVSVMIPPLVTSIGKESFYGCKSLASVDITIQGEYVLGDFAFAYCPRLTSLNLMRVSEIGASPVRGDESLTTIQVSADNNTYKSVANVIYTVDSSLLVIYPAGKTGSSYAVSTNATEIADFAFSENPYLRSVIISVKSSEILAIGENSFVGLSTELQFFLNNNSGSLSEAEILNNYKMNSHWSKYGESIFGNTATIDNFIVERLAGTDLSCRIIRYIGLPNDGSTLTIPSSLNGLKVQEIGDEAFQGNIILRRVILKDGLVKLGAHAFRNCTKLQRVDICESVMELGEGVFYGCTDLTEVNFLGNSAITIISEFCFSGCTSLKSVCIPQKVRTLALYAFSGLENAPMSLTTVEFEEGTKLNTIENNVFQYCTLMSSFSMPSTVEFLGMQLFRGCSSLTSITLNESTTGAIISLESNRVFEDTPEELIIYVSTVERQEYVKARYWKEISGKFRESESIADVIENGVAVPTYSIADTSKVYNAVRLSTRAGGYYRGVYDANTGNFDTSETRKNAFLANLPSIVEGLPLVEIDEAGRKFSQAILGYKYVLDYDTFIYTTQEVVCPVKVSGQTVYYTVYLDFVSITMQGVSILKYIGSAANLVIPQKLNGKPVLSLGGYSINSKVESLTLSFGLVEIEAQAFSYATNLKTVVVPPTLTVIGDNAFNGARVQSLQYAIRTDNPDVMPPLSDCIDYSMLTTIGNYAFYNALDFGDTPFYIPERVKSVGAYAFASSVFNAVDESTEIGSRIENFVFVDKEMESVGAFAFSNLDIKFIELPYCLKNLGDSAFKGCANLMAIYIFNDVDDASNNIIALGSNTGNILAGCPFAKVYTMPGQLNRYRNDTKWRAQGMEAKLLSKDGIIPYGEGYIALDIDASNKQSPTKNLMQYYGEKDFVIPRTVGGYTIVAIGQYAFNSTVETVTLNSEITTIQAYGFYGSSVRNVIFPSDGNLETIGSSAFAYTAITQFVIPYTVQTIFDNAFSHSALEVLSCEDRDRIPSDGETLTIRGRAFSDIANLRKVILPRRTASIGAEAFANNPKLAELYMISESLATRLDAFELSTAPAESLASVITEIREDSLISDIGSSAFAYCPMLTTVYVPFSVGNVINPTNPNTTGALGENAFAYCTGLQFVIMLRGQYGSEPSGMSVVNATPAGEKVFLGVDNPLMKILVPRNTFDGYHRGSNWVEYARDTDAGNKLEYFAENQIITYENIDGSIDTYLYAVKEAQNIVLKKYLGDKTELVIPSTIAMGALTYNVVEIGANFANDTLRSVTLEASKTNNQTIAYYAFAYATSLRTMTFGSYINDAGREVFSVTSIGAYAFFGDTSLEYVTLPHGIGLIAAHAFENCTSLQRMELPATVTTINDNAFKNCVSLNRLIIKNLGTVVDVGAKIFENVGSNFYIFVDVNMLSGYNTKSGWADYRTHLYSEDCIYGDLTVSFTSGGRCTILQYLGASDVFEVPVTIQGATVTAIAKDGVVDSVITVLLPAGSEITYGAELADKIEYAEE